MGHEVAVEVLVLRAAGDGRLAYRRQVARLAPDTAPDDAATALVGSTAVLHSTSWRRDPAWGLVLTYAALPDRQEDRTTAVELDRSGLATGVAAHAPSPPSVTVDQVISLEAARSRMQIAGELAGAGYPAEVVPALTKLVAAARQVRTEIAH